MARARKKAHDVETLLKEGSAALGVALAPEAIKRLLDYLALLKKWNKTYNLTGVREPQKMVSHHLLDSLAVLPHFEAQTLIDVGSGAGLPGLPLAVARPDWKVTLLDSNSKKIAFLKQACIELKLSNVSVVSGRAENYEPQEKFELVVARAFSSLSEFVKLAGHLAAQGGRLIAMKGVYPSREIEGLPQDCKVDRVIPLSVPGLAAQRHLVIMTMA